MIAALLSEGTRPPHVRPAVRAPPGVAARSRRHGPPRRGRRRLPQHGLPRAPAERRAARAAARSARASRASASSSCARPPPTCAGSSRTYAASSPGRARRRGVALAPGPCRATATASCAVRCASSPDARISRRFCSAHRAAEPRLRTMRNALFLGAGLATSLPLLATFYTASSLSACSSGDNNADAGADVDTRPPTPPEWDRPVTRPSDGDADRRSQPRASTRAARMPAETLGTSVPVDNGHPHRHGRRRDAGEPLVRQLLRAPRQVREPHRHRVGARQRDQPRRQ